MSGLTDETFFENQSTKDRIELIDRFDSICAASAMFGNLENIFLDNIDPETNLVRVIGNNATHILYKEPFFPMAEISENEAGILPKDLIFHTLPITEILPIIVKEMAIDLLNFNMANNEIYRLQSLIRQKDDPISKFAEDNKFLDKYTAPSQNILRLAAYLERLESRQLLNTGTNSYTLPEIALWHALACAERTTWERLNEKSA